MRDNEEQELKLVDRGLLELTGVEEVIDFDENKVRLETNLGNLIIDGSDLKMKHLDLDSKELIIKGHVRELKYDKVFKANGFFKRLFK
ncbi:sporulation protein YabP [Halanaerobacter jeridensis]|uniref:Sporulation protein YabP n=1 Tax=Halanaerobacter jeridensis TaxID=706427 RepID=A0A939BSI5_9FIRM|nr:sporulation protein YabP [Halanaerobacter jeridensis]MBM7557181.1 sporulation protein YabP [Halanaerobacter jeridensis]